MLRKILVRPIAVAVIIAFIKISSTSYFFIHYLGNILGIQDSFRESLFSIEDGQADQIGKMKPYIVWTLILAAIAFLVCSICIVVHYVGSREPKNSIMKLSRRLLPVVVFLWFLVWILGIICTIQLLKHAHGAQSAIRENIVNDKGEKADDIVSYERLFSCNFNCNHAVDPDCIRCEQHIHKTLVAMPYYCVMAVAFVLEAVLIILFVLAILRKYLCKLVACFLADEETEYGINSKPHEIKPLTKVKHEERRIINNN